MMLLEWLDVGILAFSELENGISVNDIIDRNIRKKNKTWKHGHCIHYGVVPTLVVVHEAD